MVFGDGLCVSAAGGGGGAGEQRDLGAQPFCQLFFLFLMMGPIGTKNMFIFTIGFEV